MDVLFCFLLLWWYIPTKSNKGKEGFISAYTFMSQFITAGSQGKDWSRDQEEILLTCFIWLAQPVLLHNPKPGRAAPTNGLALSTSINQDLPTGQSYGGIFLIKAAPSQKTPSLH